MLSISLGSTELRKVVVRAVAIGQVAEKVCKSGRRYVAGLVARPAVDGDKPAAAIRLDDDGSIQHHEIRIVEVFFEPGGAYQRVHRRFGNADLVALIGTGGKQRACGDEEG